MWIQFDRDLLEHDYTLSLAGLLEISQPAAAAFIALLVICGLEMGAGDNGNIGHLRLSIVEHKCYWDGTPMQLIAAFVQTQILLGDVNDIDGSDPLRINPELWHMLTDRVVKQREKWRQDKRSQRKKS